MHCLSVCLRGTGAPLVFPGPEDICTGDLVRVELDADIFKAMQEGHGGWSDPMLEVSEGDIRTNVQVRISPLMWSRVTMLPFDWFDYEFVLNTWNFECNTRLVHYVYAIMPMPLTS